MLRCTKWFAILSYVNRIFTSLTVREITMTTAQNFEQTFGPFMAYGRIAVETAEKAAKIQMDSMKAYTKLGMDNLAEGLKVSNFDQMVAYTEKQKGIAKEAGDMFMDDTKAFADLNAKFFDGAKTIFEDGIKTMTTKKETAKAASK